MYYRIPTGSLGAGKSLISVYLAMTRYIRKGRYVVTNLDFFPEHFKNKHNKNVRIIRLPDHPSAEDFASVPLGNPGLVQLADGSYGPGPNYKASQNSLLLLDELAQHMNARDYNKKGRKGIIGEVAMLRKRGYDTIFIAQSYDMIDSQVRKMVGNEVGEGINMGVIPIPLVGWIGRYITTDGEPFRFPSTMIRYHFYKVKRDNISDLKTASYTVFINDYKEVYNTAQLFSEDTKPAWAINHHELPGPYCLLTPYHLVGYKLPPPLTAAQKLKRFVSMLPFYCALPLIPFTPSKWWEFRS